MERRTSNARYDVRDGDGCEFGATTECRTSNARYAIRDVDGCECGAIIKCILSNACHAVRDGDCLLLARAGNKIRFIFVI